MSDCLALALTTKAHDLARVLSGRKVAPTRAVQFRLNLGARAELGEALIEYGAKRSSRGYVNKERALIAIVRRAMADKY